MPNVSSFGAQTDNAVVSGTVTDRRMVIPEVPPQGLMSIGPRQSPNYIKESWNAQASYVFYDVVKDGAGASYVATKPVVPAGTELTDEDYWFKWAEPNAQINELNEVVKTFNERIAQNASAITAEVARATAAEDVKAPINHASEETVYGIGNALNYGHVKLADDTTPMSSDANAGVAATPKMVNETPIRDIIVLGDSLSAGITNNGEGDSENGWAVYAKKNPPSGVRNVFSENDTVIVGNRGFTSSATFYSVLKNMIDKDLIADKDSIREIYIGAGTNDYASDANTIASAITQFCDYAKAQFPNVNITIAFIATNRIEAFEGYKQGALKNGCRFVSCVPYMGLKNYISDGTHLTKEGYKATIQGIYNLIFYGNSNCSLYGAFKFDTNLLNGFAIDGKDAAITYAVQPGGSSYMLRTVGNPFMPHIWKENFQKPNDIIPIIQKADKCMLANESDLFFPVFVQGFNESCLATMYYDANQKTFNLTPTGLTNTVGHKIDIYIPAINQYKLYN